MDWGSLHQLSSMYVYILDCWWYEQNILSWEISPSPSGRTILQSILTLVLITDMLHNWKTPCIIQVPSMCIIQVPMIHVELKVKRRNFNNVASYKHVNLHTHWCSLHFGFKRRGKLASSTEHALAGVENHLKVASQLSRGEVLCNDILSQCLSSQSGISGK